MVEETEVPRENHQPVASHGQTLWHNVVHLALIKIQINISGDRQLPYDHGHDSPWNQIWKEYSFGGFLQSLCFFVAQKYTTETRGLKMSKRVLSCFQSFHKPLGPMGTKFNRNVHWAIQPLFVLLTWPKAMWLFAITWCSLWILNFSHLIFINHWIKFNQTWLGSSLGRPISNLCPISLGGGATNLNCIGGVMVSVIASSVVDRGFEPWSGQIKDYKIGICCFSAKNAALRSKSKDWLARNKDNVSKWGNMSIRGLLFQWARTTKIQLSVLV